MTTPFWTPERKDALQRRLDEGLTFDQAAERLGTSKNACVGAATRAGMQPKDGAPLSELQKSSRAFFDARKLLRERPQQQGNPFPPSGHCVYPHGDPGTPGFHFCGEPVAIVAAPYCHEHMARCHQPQKQAQPEALAA